MTGAKITLISNNDKFSVVNAKSLQRFLVFGLRRQSATGKWRVVYRLRFRPESISKTDDR
ncbi:hypothetical protein DVH24_026414 [Malus domestica]|uniref:Uncharacterized protein n=1 Tax=Malus domestica TaxID=3750 RepID=A0A498KHV8_MALDO|nr:hypothetical protein DVH24_026414 [Malus domestica]